MLKGEASPQVSLHVHHEKSRFLIRAPLLICIKIGILVIFCQDILDEYDAKAKTPAVRFLVNLSVCRMAFYSYQMICQRESQNSGQSRKERETNIWTIFLLVEQLL